MKLSAFPILANILLFAEIATTFEPIRFKCIFDINKKITNLIPGYLVVQPNGEFGQTHAQWEKFFQTLKGHEQQNTLPTLQEVDCFLSVGNKLSISDKTEEPTKNHNPIAIAQELVLESTRNMKNTKNPEKHAKKNPIFTKEDVVHLMDAHKSKRKVVHAHTKDEATGDKRASSKNAKLLNSEQKTIEFQARKLKRLTRSKEGTTPINYRSTENDKLLRAKKYKKTTKFVRSKKNVEYEKTTKFATSKTNIEEKSTLRQKIRRYITTEDGSHQPIYYRSTEEDKLLSASTYPKTTKIVGTKRGPKSKFVESVSYSFEKTRTSPVHYTKSSTEEQKLSTPATRNAEELKDSEKSQQQRNQPHRSEETAYPYGLDRDSTDNEIFSSESLGMKNHIREQFHDDSFGDKDYWEIGVSATESGITKNFDDSILDSENIDGDGGYYCRIDNSLNGDIICSKVSNEKLDNDLFID